MSALHVVNLHAWETDALDLNEEASIGTWVSTTYFALAGFCAAGIASLRRRAHEWWIVATVAFALSIDDVVQLHEQIEDGLDDSRVVFVGWAVLPIAAGVIALSLRRLPAAKEILFVAGAVLGSAQAIGFVLAERKLLQFFDALVFVEEFGELVASALVLVAVAPYAVVAARRAFR